MNAFRFKSSLRLRHPSMHPEEISAGIGLRSEFSWKAGAARTTPRGEILRGTNSLTYWCSQSVEGDGCKIAELLGAELARLEEKRSFLLEFTSTGGSIEYFIAWFTNGLNTGALLDWELLARLSALHIDLDLDIYGVQRPSHSELAPEADTNS
jgi:hypothetical protein